MMKMFFASTMIAVLSGCASLNSVSVTPIPANRSMPVTAESSRWIFLGFNFDNDYADEVAKKLSATCEGGKVTGILTKDEMYMYFSVFVMKRKVVANGYCLRNAKVAMGEL